MKLTDVIADLLQRKPTDASKRWHPGMETQILAKKPGFPIRIDESNPDPNLPFDPELITRIGTTGRNYKTGMAEVSLIDIDAADGHAKGHKPDVINMIIGKLGKLPYIEMFRSTGGKGLHLHVPLHVPAANRSEHSKLGDYVVDQISADAGFDLRPYVDVAGGNLWIWA